MNTSEYDRLSRKIARIFHVPVWLIGYGTKKGNARNAQLLRKSRSRK